MTNSRDKLIATLDVLAQEAAQGQTSTWENVTLPRYLDALAAWLRVYERAYINTDRPIPEDVWEIMIDAVKAATVYE